MDLEAALDTVLSSSQNQEMVLVGDFNIPEFDWNTDCASVDSPNATLLSDIIHDNFLVQLVKDPTRNGNILDLVFVTSPDLVYDLKVSLPGPFLIITRSLCYYRENHSLDGNHRS